MNADLPSDLIDRLLSLHDWCREVEALLEGANDTLFETRRVHELALSKAVEQVGELSGRILRKHPGFAAAHPELELLAAYTMRNRLVHGYDDVIVAIVVATGRRDIPVLKAALEPILSEAGEDVA
ncbi:HepT-like ribonuclease domain-containing protein [Fulvimarina endophytica]|uniref:HepT-like ribonuclease domain-containing protein n=1 Tax=Fulvimarina endophytica TaxID=2293836 RepID=UPI001313F85B|nr:HepT-like ribonuclease domain-containing protein [Fulvimarina endophytica]